MMRQLRTVARPLLAAARAPATRSLPRCVVSSTSSLRQFHQHVRSTRVVAPLANSQSWSARNYSAAPEPLTKQQVEDRVMQVLRDFDKVKGDKLTVDAHFINDLGLDSLDQVEITMALEDEFNIEIPDRDAEEIFTVRQAVDKKEVQQFVSQRPGSHFKTQNMALLGLSSSSESIWLRVVVLSLVGILAFSSRLFSVIRFESVIHEFDPWFNYRTTRQLVENGFYDFVNWFDELSWYPLGRVVGGTVYPGIMVTAGAIHYILNLLHFPIDIREVCVFLAPLFSAFTAVAAYLFTSEIKDSSAGLLAAVFIGIAPGYISRSVAGSYDNEGIAIFLLMFTFYLWLKSVKLGSAFYGGLTALFYFYMVSAWGGYVFIINLIPLHAFALILMGRFSTRLYVGYSTFYVLGTLMSMQIPFVGFQPTRTSEHMAALGIFGLLQIIAFVNLIKSHLSENQFQLLFQGLILGFFILGFTALVALTVGGYIAPWTGRFYSLWDTGYAKKYIPIIASVSEHQPTPWPSFFFDLQLLIPLFPAGIYFCFKELRDEHIFVILYAATASYFAGVMVRLMLTLTPVVCVAAAVAMSKLLDIFLAVPDESKKPVTSSASSAAADATASKSKPEKEKKKKEKEKDATAVTGIWGSDSKYAILFPITFILCQFVWHCTWVTSNAYSSPSIVLASRGHDGSQIIIDDFREAYYWLRQNTDEKAKIMSWWDYGYQIAGMANRTVLVDNNTWNNTHIATVGKAMACSEDVSYEVMRKLDVDYVLVIFGSAIGYSGDDINKFLWMIRIGEGVYPNDVNERSFFTDSGEYRVDDKATSTMKNSLMYKMSYYRFPELYGPQPAYDRVRGSIIPKKPIKLSVVDEAYTTENMIVRIYAVKPPDNIGRSMSAAASFGKKRRRRSRKLSKGKK
ncbi:oligosaccharyl transferase stt3 subunit [Quaeritorhiza haematococci]|nr:oligosaccharyl transferase stt3 subunit [Quaeritorhiza haematococci]